MTSTYIKPTDEEMFRLGKVELRQIANGRPSKRQQAAADELARRKANKAAKAAS